MWEFSEDPLSLVTRGPHAPFPFCAELSFTVVVVKQTYWESLWLKRGNWDKSHLKVLEHSFRDLWAQICIFCWLLRRHNLVYP